MSYLLTGGPYDSWSFPFFVVECPMPIDSIPTFGDIPYQLMVAQKFRPSRQPPDLVISTFCYTIHKTGYIRTTCNVTGMIISRAIYNYIYIDNNVSGW